MKSEINIFLITPNDDSLEPRLIWADDEENAWLHVDIQFAQVVKPGDDIPIRKRSTSC